MGVIDKINNVLYNNIIKLVSHQVQSVRDWQYLDISKLYTQGSLDV